MQIMHTSKDCNNFIFDRLNSPVSQEHDDQKIMKSNTTVHGTNYTINIIIDVWYLTI